ncbi:MAG: NAD-dependent epimerase/dehydratase family protein [Chloroflexi bacterium]|nr:NAD-dependent epimerase/dehydratase family protein [Chloroflexota bacterium]MCL5274165.1 NAD-dependent epimerase/dehydratase family protein [Chloroflexota bacterium]
MKILVTGATGFLGTTLCRYLEAADHALTRLGSKDCDLTMQGSLDQYNGQTFDQIWHLAAWTQAGDFPVYHAGEQWINNQQINTNVLTWWRDRQQQAKLICMGTSCAYATDMDLAESNFMVGEPIESLYAYGMTKRMLYAGLLALHKQYKMNYLCLIPSTLYGPGYHTDGRQMHFIFDLIRKILRGKLFGDPVVLWGDGYQKRELVYIDDFVRIALKLNGEIQNELINIGAGIEYPIRRFAEAICQIVEYDPGLIKYDTTRYVGATSKCLNIRKLQGLIPDLGFTSLEEGLRKTIDWFQANPQTLGSR